MDLANVFNDEEVSERANSITSSDLDPFLLQGDEQTWAVEDWNWDPFNMFAAPKEVPNVACCQALKRRKVADISAAPQQQQLQQQEQALHQQQAQTAACHPCHGPSAGNRAGPPSAPAAACCSFAAPQQTAQQHAHEPMAAALQAALGSLMPNRANEACGAAGGPCHGPGPMMVPPAPIPVAAPVAATGPGMGGGMGMAVPPGMAWPGMHADMSNPAAAAAAAMAAAANSSGFFGMMSGGHGPMTGMGPWGPQPVALQMPSAAAAAAAAAMGLAAFPGSQGQPRNPNLQQQYAPALNVPMPAYPAPAPSGVFNQQASVALPPSSVPSPALGSSGETSSLQASADNAKPPCCSGNRGGGGPTSSGGRQQADSSNKANLPLHPTKAGGGQQAGGISPNGGGNGNGKGAIMPGDMSDFAISDSEDEDEVARRPGAGAGRGGQGLGLHPQGGQSQSQAQALHLLGDVVALHDVGDDNGLMVCQVPGCGKDLSNLKEYHQRYRICDVHIKLQQVMKDGRLQRFCQQCGRFHDLTAFDGNRKSCRDQLSKHNARRRRRAQAEQAKGRNAVANDAAMGSAAVAMAAAAAVGGAATATAGIPFDGDVGKLLASLMSNPTQLHALRLLLGVPTHPALPPSQPAPGMGGLAGLVGSPADSTSDTAAASDQTRTYGLARDILAGRNDFAPAFESEHRLIRLSMKLFNRTPADLPMDLRNQVTSWLASAPSAMEAAIRPGCVFLTVQMLVDEASAAQAAAPGALPSLAQHLLTRTGCPFWHAGMYTLQLHENMLLIRDGKIAGDSSATSRPAVAGPAATVRAGAPGAGDGHFPVIKRLGPLAAMAGQPTVLKVHGQNLDAPGCMVVLRWGNQHLKAHMQALSSHRALVRLPPLPDICGPVWVEVARGAYLSPAKQLLVARDEALVDEINRLDVRHGRVRQETVELLLQDMALVLQHIAGQPGVAAQLPHASIALKARRLLAMACDMGWAAVASAVLPLACARCSCAAEMVAAIHAASVPSSTSTAGAGPNTTPVDRRGLTLLHRAVRSGSVSLLAGMLAWGDSHGYRWRVDAAGPAGITPLHLAAMQDEPRVALLLLDHCGWPAAFTHLRSDGGVTPFHMAFQMGHYQVDSLMASLGGLQQVVDPATGANNAAGAPAAAAAHAAGRRSRCGSSAAAAAGGGAFCKQELGDDLDDAKPLGRVGGNHHHNHNNNGGGCAELDPCEVCQCTLPPLLLTIMASCNECGRRRMCLEAECAAAVGRSSGCSCGAARPTVRSDTGELCSSREHSTRFSITALCQGCHGNRVLAVA